MTPVDEIRCERRGRLAVVTLNRPQALNALSLAMIEQLDRWLAAWATDAAVAAVLIRGAGGKAFCAGGDIRALYRAGPGAPLLEAFYRAEYRLNYRIRRYAKPIVAPMDGIVMGGGAGLSLLASHPIATERTRFAMPETGIGFFPDVGASWFLPRCPGAVGLYLGLTGAQLGAADMVYCGLVARQAPSARLPDLIDGLAGMGDSGDAQAVFDRLAVDPGPAPLAALRPAIDRCFAAESVEAILAALATEGGAWATETAALLRRRSPTSLKVAHRQLRAARGLEFAAAMRMEFRLSQHFMAGQDFFEGVRAVVIDKDQAPRWRPGSLAAVSDAAVAGYFAPLRDRPDLALP